mmetsp:Transcript_36350/g.87761  ORF Transcript_36350/g.87761 Transcript_36350/m.87761 type:complete len:1773 (-) Transcript_36350:3283-8601(-)
MRITMPFSFWLAIAVNLPYVDAFTPPSLFSLPERFGGGESVGNHDRAVRERGWGPFRNILGDNERGHQRLQQSRHSPFYFANIPSATSLSAAASSGDGIEINDSRKKYGQAEVARARTRYLDWCSEYRKTPEEKRFHQFVDNFLVMEAMARKQGTQIRLNEFADCTAEEYQKIMAKGGGAGGGPGQSQLNKDLKMVDQTSTTKKKPVPAASPATSSGTTASTPQNTTAPGAGTTTNSTQAAVQQAKAASQQASQAVASAQQKVGGAVSSSTASKPPPATAATAGKKSSTIIPPDEMGNDDAKLLAQQKEQQRVARKAQAEAAQRAELERARLRKEQEKAQRDAELAAQKAEKEKSKKEAIAAQRRKVEEAERKRRELVSRAEAAQRAEAAAAKARREAEEQKRKEEEAAAAAAKAKAEEEERQRKLKEEEERLQKERELAAEKARQKAEALAKKQAEEARLKKEEEEIQAAAEAKRKAEELVAKKAEEARLKKEREEKAAAEAKQKAEELARLKTEQARLKKEQQERAAAEAARKAEEEARKKAEEKSRLKKEQEEKAAAEAKRKQEELERLAKEREILLEKKRQQELEAKRKRDEAVLLKRKQEGEIDQKKLVEASNRLVSVLSKEQNVLSEAESKLEADREKAILEHKQKIVEVLKSRAADLEATKFQVSKDTKTLLSTLTDARSNLQELETKLAAGRQKVVTEYQQRQKEMTEAERKQEAELQKQRQREQRELAARRKIEEDKRRQEEILARQKAEEEAKKRALEEKRRLEAIAREKRKAEEELRVKNLATQAEKEAEEKRAREEKRQKEITEKAKAAALAAKKDAKEKKKMEDLKRKEDMENEDIPKYPVASKDKPTEKVFTTIDKQSDNSQVSSVVKDEDRLSDSDPKKETVAISDEEKEKSLDEQLAELTSMIDELQRESDDAEADKPPVEEATDDTVAEPTKSKDDSVDSSSKDSKDKVGKGASKATASSSKEAGSEVDGKAKKKDEAEEDLRIRSAYLDWCISYSKKPDMTRIQQFKKNYLLIEEFAKENGKEIKLNDYADCTAAEYERAMKEKEDIKKKEEDEQKKREEEAAASYKAAVDEASQLFGVDGNTTAVAKDDSVGAADGSAPISEDDTIATGDPDDVWKTGEPTMSMWQPEDDGESMWASEGGASVWESRESSEWGEIDESYSALGTVDPDDPEVRRRVRSAYSNWCREYNKETDESRFPRFKTNYLKMEQMAWEQGNEITLNEFADCSPEEYRNAVGLGSSHEEDRLERLRREQEAEAEQQTSSRSREDRIERLRREQEEQAARRSAKRTVESVWKVGEPTKRVKDIRVDWDQDETAAIEEVERMALEKAEAAARRVEEARKNKSPRSPASSDPPAFRSNKNDVDRQLMQKAMDERRRRDDGEYFSRKKADERRNVDEEQSKLEEEFSARSRAKEEDNRLKRQWDREQVQRDVGRQPSTPDFENPTPKAEPSPAFNLGSIFGIGNNGKASSPPPGNDPVVDPNEPIVKPPGSFEPKVKAPAYDNKAWQDQYIKNYDPTAGGGFRNGGNDSVSKSQLEPPSPSSGDSYFMDLSNGLEDRGRTPEPVPPSNDEWYEDSLSQPRPPHSPADPFSSLEGRSSPNPGGVAPDEAELDATPSRFVQGAESYLGDLSPPPSNGAASSSGYAEKDAAKSFTPPPTPTPEPSASTAASPPRGARSSGSYLDNLQSQFPERIESAYRDWCQYYGKEASEDRLRIFASNFLAVEKYHRETGVSLILNELADMTSDEFQSNPKNGKA